MKLPKTSKVRKLDAKLFLGEGILIKLPKDSELEKAFPKLTDFAFERENAKKFNDVHKLQIELKTICEDLLKISTKKK